MSSKGGKGKAPAPAKGKPAAKPAAGGKGGKAGKGDGGGDGSFSQVKVRHILCEKEAKLNEAIALINSGKTFNSVAQSHSEDKARASGLLGYIKKGDMVEAFTDKAFSQPIGVVSAPFKTQYGYHIILVEERKQ